MVDIQRIQPHMPVICSNDVPFAKVDHAEGDTSIKLARDDKGQHHFIPLAWVKSVDASGIHLDRPGKQAMQEWSLSPQR